MPFSNRELASVIRAWCRDNREDDGDWTMLDAGAGCGTYAMEVGDLFDRTIAVEVWEPYVDQFQLRQKYDTVVVGDLRDPMVWSYVDVVFLGDVLEHFTEEDAQHVWQLAREFAVKIILCIPIIEYPQGAEYGNPHEEHKHTWTHDMVMALPGIERCLAQGVEVGVYVAGGA